MSYQSRTGAVLFASSLDRVATFYSLVLGLTEASRDDGHILLESQGFQLVVHRIPSEGAYSGVDARFDTASRATREHLHDPRHQRRVRGHVVADGIRVGANRPTRLMDSGRPRRVPGHCGGARYLRGPAGAPAPRHGALNDQRLLHAVRMACTIATTTGPHTVSRMLPIAYGTV